MAEDIRTMHEEDEDEVKYCERKRLLFFGLPWTFTKYTITPSMLTIDQGLLKTEENDCYMYKVQDVKLTTTLLERIFGLGTITCYTGDVTKCGTETDPHQKVKGSQKLSFESIRSGTYETPHIKYTRHWSCAGSVGCSGFMI